MPASSADSVSHIEGTLKASLHPDGRSLDKQLISSSRKVLLHKIDFQPARKSSTFQLDNLRAKYTPLNPSSQTKATEKSVLNGQSNGSKDKGRPVL